MYEVIKIGEEKIEELYKIEENYFNDFKAKDILPSRLSKTVSAFANASGGDIYLGIREENKNKVLGRIHSYRRCKCAYSNSNIYGTTRQLSRVYFFAKC